MIPVSILAIADTISKIVLLALQDQPAEIRRANAIIVWSVFWRLIRHFFPDDTRAEVEAELKGAQASTAK
jgi:hypothetical protein